jgi:RHS repeat-associated protein
MRGARPSTIAGAFSRNEHLYNGKELFDELSLNWYHYGVRYYDVALARWVEMDPADEFHSPYTYVGGPGEFDRPEWNEITTLLSGFSFGNG